MTRTLFIGMDGATFTILDDMTRDVPGQGIVMPFLKNFMENGVRAKLRSTPNPLTPPAWVSIMTGRTPGNHGIYDFVRFEDKGDDVYFTLYDSRDILTETIWSIASRQGCTITALNFPFTAPPREVNGSLVPGFVPWKHLRRNTTPKELYDRLKEIPNFDPKGLAWDFEKENKILTHMTGDDLYDWVVYHIEREIQWFKVAEKLLKEDQSDLMAMLFDGTDKTQHQIWSVLDLALYPANPEPWQIKVRKSILEYFAMLDGFIARLVELAGPDAQVFMCSDHGFTATTEVVRINVFLEQKGYLAWAQNDGTEQAKRREETQIAYLDWERTFAYCPTPSSNGIAIRVSDGAGKPGIKPEDYHTFREKLIRDLEEFTDEHGEPIIRNIYKREDVYNGPALNEAPDLTLVLRDYGFVSVRNVEPAVEPREAPQGTHHPDGVFLAGGPGIKAGFKAKKQQVADVPATLLYSMGLPIPSNFEGKVAESFFTDDYLAKHPVSFGSATGDKGAMGDVEGLTQEDKNQILEQLQMLGYME